MTSAHFSPAGRPTSRRTFKQSASRLFRLSRNFATVLLGALSLAACSNTGVAIHYYLIDPIDQAPLSSGSTLSIHISDLTIPQYLDRFQIVRRHGNQLILSETDQWAENLRKNLLRTLARNLSSLLNTPDVGTATSRSASSADYHLKVRIEQFEQNATGDVILSGRYQVRRSQDKLATLTKQFLLTERAVSTGNTEFIVQSMQTQFNDLCIELAQSVLDLEHSQQ